MIAHKQVKGTRMLNGASSRARLGQSGRSRESLTPAVACRPIASALEPRPAVPEPAPIWFAALVATRCQAMGHGEGRTVGFEYVSGRALYTNSSSHAENIDPLGVTLLGGQTLAVYWEPGETSYTCEVYRPDQRACA